MFSSSKMKFKLNILLLCAAICSFRSVESRSHRGNIDVSEYELVKEDLKYKPDRTDTHDMSNKVKSSKLFTSPLKQTVKHIKVYANPLNVKNRNYADQTTFHDTLVINKPKSNIPSIKVGEHEIKVSSILHTKHVDIKSKDGVKEISVNPKFSHIIEILSRKDPSTLTDKELSHTKTPEVSEGKIIEPFTERLNFNGLGDEEANTEQLSGNLNETDKITTSDLKEEKFELNEENLKLPRDQLSEISASTTLPLNTDEILENIVNTETADLGSRSGENEELVFRDEFEGSGEEFSFDNVASLDQNAPKDGRLLNLISQTANNSSACTTPKGESGQCRRIRDCILSDALNNFNVFLRQLCLIRGVLVGICCPDNPVIETTNTEESTTETNVDENTIEQPPEGCGLNTKTRIVGGTISAPHEWTWMVALLRRNRFYCGGVIINNWYILTAAHCILGMDVKDLTVRLGEYDFNDDSKQKEDISVAEIKRHAQFVTLTFQHDIALLKLQRSIRYSKFVGSICLPTQIARDYSDVNGTVVGWGTVSFGGAASPILRQVTVPVWKNEDCDRTYFLENINDAFLCAGSPEKGEDACQGDSGGPLMTLNERGRWEVIGIVSWGRRCGDPTYPGVYTRVTTYMDWILQNID